MAIYDTIKMSITQYQNELVHIFTDNLNSLYILNTQIKRPSIHNNHFDKTILLEMITLHQRTYPLTIYKVRAYSNIRGNDKVDILAKEGNKQEHKHPCFPNKHAYSTLYYLYKDFWLGNMTKTPYKGLI